LRELAEIEGDREKRREIEIEIAYTNVALGSLVL